MPKKWVTRKNTCDYIHMSIRTSQAGLPVVSGKWWLGWRGFPAGRQHSVRRVATCSPDHQMHSPHQRSHHCPHHSHSFPQRWIPDRPVDSWKHQTGNWPQQTRKVGFVLLRDQRVVPLAWERRRNRVGFPPVDQPRLSGGLFAQ